MQIQRIQTVTLFIAAVLMAIFCFTPFADIEAADATIRSVYVKDAPVLLVVNLLIAILLILAIFMYKNLRMQMKMTVLSMVLICVSIVASFFYIYAGFEGATPVLFGGVMLLVLAVIFALLALRGMRHDPKLLRSGDRLR